MQDIKFSSEAVADLFHAVLLSIINTGLFDQADIQPRQAGPLQEADASKYFHFLVCCCFNPELNVLHKHVCHYHYSGCIGGYQGIQSECCLEEVEAELCS
jgi:hypothetical protein